VQCISRDQCGEAGKSFPLHIVQDRTLISPIALERIWAQISGCCNCRPGCLGVDVVIHRTTVPEACRGRSEGYWHVMVPECWCRVWCEISLAHIQARASYISMGDPLQLFLFQGRKNNSPPYSTADGVLLAASTVVTTDSTLAPRSANARWPHSPEDAMRHATSLHYHVPVSSQSYDQSLRISFALIASAAFLRLRRREKFPDASSSLQHSSVHNEFRRWIFRLPSTRLPLHCTHSATIPRDGPAMPIDRYAVHCGAPRATGQGLRNTPSRLDRSADA
jgi:hypothetical protein